MSTVEDGEKKTCKNCHREQNITCFLSRHRVLKKNIAAPPKICNNCLTCRDSALRVMRRTTRIPSKKTQSTITNTAPFLFHCDVCNIDIQIGRIEQHEKGRDHKFNVLLEKERNEVI